MFGGLSHEPAIRLAEKLVELTPAVLQQVFSAIRVRSPSVALKMAIQYWRAQGNREKQNVNYSLGYHGDTFAAMSVCDPVTGMHELFTDILTPQFC